MAGRGRWPTLDESRLQGPNPRARTRQWPYGTQSCLCPTINLGFENESCIIGFPGVGRLVASDSYISQEAPLWAVSAGHVRPGRSSTSNTNGVQIDCVRRRRRQPMRARARNPRVPRSLTRSPPMKCRTRRRTAPVLVRAWEYEALAHPSL
ncbi:hypothetical protein BCR34DRAFT_56231 [Clohesyomyces aquaticus]|uniref:Uncharacterized protein n=1 Tax=Clohesyomyces aquaticus TaxID=1231657 RepID=A0A1Y1Z2D7_9PLEO|nr:hypothetical protein BCR34DRAFT_56231 [Clohesyomyces aquaticus]